jgi:ABC-2 type transport system permease protein
MTAALRQSWQINLRYLRAFVRQPAWVAIALVQPVIWLLLFGALFKRVVDIPGFEGSSYIAFLTPGVAVMTAVMSAGWNGMGFIEDMRRGVLDRVLVSPLWRGALNAGSLLYAVTTLALQVLIIIGIGLLAGASFENGVAGIAILVLVASLLGGSFAALSNGLALVTRQRETLIGAVTFVTLPITFRRRRSCRRTSRQGGYRLLLASTL